VSIYTTLWEIKIPLRHSFDGEWVMVYGQAVPAYVGHPSVYPEGDPFADFLPPIVKEYEPETDAQYPHRAVFIVQEGRDEMDGQRYVDPLLVFTGEEYSRMTFQKLLDRIYTAIGWDETAIALQVLPSGEKKTIRSSE
jgi:hypothetical protein